MHLGFRQARQSVTNLGSKPVHASGFTLIELLVTIAIAAVLLALAVPSFTSIINNNRLASQSNSLVAGMQTARMEAVRRNARVSVCRSTDGATCAGAVGAWTQWLTLQDSTNEVLSVNTVKVPVQVSSAVSRITFGADGLARPAAGGALLNSTMVTCIPTTKPAENRRVVSIVGGSRISTDSVNGGGVCP